MRLDSRVWCDHPGKVRLRRARGWVVDPIRQIRRTSLVELHCPGKWPDQSILLCLDLAEQGAASSSNATIHVHYHVWGSAPVQWGHFTAHLQMAPAQSVLIYRALLNGLRCVIQVNRVADSDVSVHRLLCMFNGGMLDSVLVHWLDLDATVPIEIERITNSFLLLNFNNLLFGPSHSAELPIRLLVHSTPSIYGLGCSWLNHSLGSNLNRIRILQVKQAWSQLSSEVSDTEQASRLDALLCDCERISAS